jgi:hypothetical protein
MLKSSGGGLIPFSNRNSVSVYGVTVKQKILNVRLCTPAVFYLPVPSIHLTLFLFENGIKEKMLHKKEGNKRESWFLRVYKSADELSGEPTP